MDRRKFLPTWAFMRFKVYLWVPDGSSSNQEWNFGDRISSSSDVPGSGEGSRAEYEDMENEGLGSAARKSSWVNSHSSRRGLDSADKEVYSVI